MIETKHDKPYHVANMCEQLFIMERELANFSDDELNKVVRLPEGDERLETTRRKTFCLIDAQRSINIARIWLKDYLKFEGEEK